jgi:predicted DNA-binding protein YlxM (UPF0122 family)|nr:MAG TPA: Transcriptional regulatory protein RcsB factor, DNA BINDING PROTEIN.6A [Caudoviricetes sp.]
MKNKIVILFITRNKENYIKMSSKMVWVNYIPNEVICLLNKEKVKKYYFDEGYTQEEVAKKMGVSVDAISKCIQRNFSHLKLKHKIALFQGKEVNKALEHEGNRYMSDRSFILKNPSIYKTLPNGDIVLKEESAKIVTMDVPKKLINENNKELIDKRIEKSNYRKENILFNC